MYVKNIQVVLLLICVVILSGREYALKSFTDKVEKASHGVVVICTFDKKMKPVRIGAGFFISSDGECITNLHIVEKYDKVVIKTRRGIIYRVESVISKDKENDIALLKVNTEGEEVEFLGFEKSLPGPGEQVFLPGKRQTISRGIVEAVKLYNGKSVIQITVPLFRDTSGSPVMNIRGDVIGIASFTITDNHKLSFVVPSSKVEELLEEDKGVVSCKSYAECMKAAERSFADGNLEKSAEFVMMALEFKSKVEGVYLFINKLCADEERSVESLRFCRNIFKSYRNQHSLFLYLKALYNAGIYYYNRQDYKEGVEVFKELELQKMKNVGSESFMDETLIGRYTFIYAQCCGNTGKEFEAIELYKMAMKKKLDNDEEKASIFNLGRLYFEIKDYKKCSTYLNRYLDYYKFQTKDELLPYTYYLLAMNKYSIIESQINCFMKADNSKSRKKMAKLINRKKDILGYLGKAVKLRPDYEEAWAQLSRIYILANRKADSISACKELISRFPDSEYIREYKDRLNSVQKDFNGTEKR